MISSNGIGPKSTIKSNQSPNFSTKCRSKKATQSMAALKASIYQAPMLDIIGSSSKLSSSSTSPPSSISYHSSFNKIKFIEPLNVTNESLNLSSNRILCSKTKSKATKSVEKRIDREAIANVQCSSNIQNCLKKARLSNIGGRKSLQSLMNCGTSNRNNCVNLSDFDILKVLGTGAYGKVFLVRKIGGSDHNKLYAMKVLKKSSVIQKQKTLEHTRTERTVLEIVRDRPFFVCLHYAFQTSTKLHLILDYVSGGELFTHLYQRDYFPEDAVRIYAAELVLALEDLHKIGIIYRDIKLENILLDSEGHIVLADFGLCKRFLPHEKNFRTYSFCGTIEYMAPEIVSGHGHTFSADWWSFGVLIYELLTGASPFTVDGEKNTQQEISKRIVRNHPPIPTNLSYEVRDLLNKILVKEPHKRLGGGSDDAQEIKNHPFFKSIDWQDLAARKIATPFTPHITDELDTSNFAEEFTRLAPNISLLMGESKPIGQNNLFIKNVCDENLFKEYSYISPSFLSNDKTIAKSCLSTKISLNSQNSTTHLFQQHSNYRPNIKKIVEAKSNDFFNHYDLVNDSGRNQIDEINCLGDGSFSVCYRCIHRKSGHHFAVKIVRRYLRRDSQTGMSYDAAINERSLLQTCQGHNNIVKLIEVFQDDHYMFIVLELLEGGELLSRIRQHACMSEHQAWSVFHQLVLAVNHLHSHNIVHRDLKPENVMFQSFETENIKLIDFGFARFVPTSNYLMTTPCCTLNYAAPEVLYQAVIQAKKNAIFLIEPNLHATMKKFYHKGYSNKCDLWSLGAVLYTMLTGRIPFQSFPYHLISNKHSPENVASVLGKMLNNQEFNFRRVNYSSAAQSVIDGLLNLNPDQRFSMKQLLEHPWFLSGPLERISVSYQENSLALRSISKQKQQAATFIDCDENKRIDSEKSAATFFLINQNSLRRQRLKMKFIKKPTNNENSVLDSGQNLEQSKLKTDSEDEFMIVDFTVSNSNPDRFDSGIHSLSSSSCWNNSNNNSFHQDKTSTSLSTSSSSSFVLHNTDCAAVGNPNHNNSEVQSFLMPVEDSLNNQKAAKNDRFIKKASNELNGDQSRSLRLMDRNNNNVVVCDYSISEQISEASNHSRTYRNLSEIKFSRRKRRISTIVIDD
uniref:non-specific serine/threonine protein kinase n=1 Tax=Sarcoptes scabiei TaxID=52283 RepID=A0A834RHD7_SARSC